MTLVKFKNEMGNMIDKFPFMPTVFGDFFNDFMNSDVMSRDIMHYVPAVNINEKTNDFVIELAAPGLNKEDFKIEVDNGVLTISSEKKENKEETDNRYTRREFAYSSFKRSFSLPENVEADKISASHSNGVLSLTLPKTEEAKKKAAKEIRIS